MNRQTDPIDDSREQFQQWCFQEAVELERKRKDLEERQRDFEEEQRSFERQKREFRFKQEMEDKRLEQKERLLEMKRRILEEELRRLAGEKEQLEQERRFYARQKQEKANSCGEQRELMRAASEDLFFKGVGNELALKKRYKDLLKIYHPDNLDGDTFTLQEINREYEKLKKTIV